MDEELKNRSGEKTMQRIVALIFHSCSHVAGGTLAQKIWLALSWIFMLKTIKISPCARYPITNENMSELCVFAWPRSAKLFCSASESFEPFFAYLFEAFLAKLFFLEIPQNSFSSNLFQHALLQTSKADMRSCPPFLHCSLNVHDGIDLNNKSETE